MHRPALALAFILLCLAGQARATPLLGFSFTFADTNDPSSTVSGRILGLSDNATGPAVSVVVDRLSANYASALPSLSVDFTSVMQNASFNTFTVTNGVLTYAFFLDGLQLGSAYTQLQLVPGLGAMGYPGYFRAGGFMDSIRTIDPDRSSLTFAALDVQDVPEPGSFGLLLAAALALAAGVQAARRSTASSRT